MQVGFIGTGNISTPIAASILKAGFPLIVHDIVRRKADYLLELGARWADSPRELAAHCDVICSCLPGPQEMEEVVLGKDGILEGVRAGSTYIDHTTNSPSLAQRVHGIFSGHGVAMLDAPVSGGVEGAWLRDLLVMVGGDAETFVRCKPILVAIAWSISHHLEVLKALLPWRWLPVPEYAVLLPDRTLTP